MKSHHKRFVLCIDDDTDDRLIICEAIRDIDPTLSVVEVGNGVEAKKFLQQAKLTGELPCLVILDINMPLMDGKETLKEIKNDITLRHLPVVFYTTSSNPRDESFSREYGVELVTKPCSYNLIVSGLKEILSRCNR
jgi:CheY-like chemotaxis protein